jgi:hypothetical protein
MMLRLNYKAAYGAVIPASQKGHGTEEFGILDSKVFEILAMV